MSAFLPLAILVSLLAAGAGAATADDYSHTPAPRSGKLLVRVEGLVYRQSCAHRNSWSLDGASPLPGAKLTVTCRDPKNRVMAWRSPVTDDGGYFLAEFGVASAADYYMGDPAKACFVRLLSSPDRKCDERTNINYGIVGAPLRDEGKNGVYAAGPLAFRPASCAPTRRY